MYEQASQIPEPMIAAILPSRCTPFSCERKMREHILGWREWLPVELAESEPEPRASKCVNV
jgi:hypothetical protein